MQESGSIKSGVEVFISYAQTEKDMHLREVLDVHLRSLDLFIDVWHDQIITAGMEWKREITMHLGQADIHLATD